MKNKHKARFFNASRIASVLLFTAVFAILVFALRDTSASVTSEGKKTAEQAIVRAAVSCYSIEGEYPKSYEYLRDNYSLMIDEEKYAVHYIVFASNIMPDVTVVERWHA